MPTDQIEAGSKPPEHAFWGPRQEVIGLVVFHLCLSCAASWLSWQVAAENIRTFDFESIDTWVAAGLYGFQIGQIILLASWGAFADQSWYLRVPRFLSLSVWMLLLGSLGEYLVAGEIAGRLVEEQLAYFQFLIFSPLVVLVSFGIHDRRRFTLGNFGHGTKSLQFSTRSLLMITAETAVLLAIGKVVLPKQFKVTEFWAALTMYHTEELIPALVSATMLPVVFVGLAKRRTWWQYAVIALCLLMPPLGLAGLQYSSQLYNRFTPNPQVYWWPLFGRMFREYLLTHLSAAATILFTFYLIRRFGYDFRRPDEGPIPDGRNSSNACNSAASASA